MSNIRIRVVQLQSDDGTRYSVGGIEVDEESGCISGTDFTVNALKPLIIQQFFPGQQMSKSRIKVYSFPVAAAAAAATDTDRPRCVPQDPTADIEYQQQN